MPVAFFFDTLYISVVQKLLLFGVQFHVFSTFIPTSIYNQCFQEEPIVRNDYTSRKRREKTREKIDKGNNLNK